jgi:hypothetical protein
LVEQWSIAESKRQYQECDRITAILGRVPDDYPSSKPLPLGLVDAPNSHKLDTVRVSKKRNRKGLKGATPYTRQLISDCVKVMTERHAKGALAFWTATIPPMSYKDYVLICQGWRSIIKRLRVALERLLASKGLAPEVLFVTEVQPERYSTSGFVGLHVHGLFPTSKGSGCFPLVLIAELDALWANVLSKTLNRQVDVSSACKIKRVKGSPHKELSKYLSKKGEIISQICADGKGNLLPTSYFNCSESIKKEAKQRVKTFTSKAVEVFYDNTELLEKYGYCKFRLVEITLPSNKFYSKSRKIIVGKFGFIKDEFIEMFDWLLATEERMRTFIGYLSQKTVEVA